MDKKGLFIFQFCHNDVLRFWLFQISIFLYFFLASCSIIWFSFIMMVMLTQ